MCLRNLRKYFAVSLFLLLFLSAGLSADSLNPKSMSDLELVEKLVQNYQKQEEILTERQKTLEELKSQLQASQSLSLTLQTRLSDLENSMTNTRDSIERTQNSLTNFSQEYEKELKSQRTAISILAALLIISSVTTLALTLT